MAIEDKIMELHKETTIAWLSVAEHNMHALGIDIALLEKEVELKKQLVAHQAELIHSVRQANDL